MKLTKTLEAEILKAYNGCWKAYLEGDLKTHASFLSDQFKFIGTSEGEQFNSKKEWVSYCKKTIKKFAGVIQKKTRDIKVVPIGEDAMVTENSDLYVLIDKSWTYYSKMRISAVLQKEKSGWKFIHQHGSLPDARAREGEVIAAEQIKKENLQLREAVKRRTAELENKNRKLEIESALERVRAVALGIKQPADMIEICRIISQQLSSLGIKEIRNVQTAIFYDKGTYMNYEYYAKHKKTIITEVEYTGPKVHKDQKNFAKTMMSSEGSIYTKSFRGQKLKDWYAYQKTTNQLADKFLLTAQSLNYYWYSLGPVALGISTYYPLTKSEVDLFLRFKNVFDLAYRRYLDIEKAEAQAREAQIEAALEKVRAQAMSMHKPDELLNVCEVMYKELRALGFDEIRNAMIHTFDKKDEFFLDYDFSGAAGGKISQLPTKGFYQLEYYFKEIKKSADTFLEMVLTGEQLKSWKKERKTTGQLDDPRMKSMKALYYYYYSIGTGAIGISTFSSISKEKRQILERFRNVFQLSYQRYHDIEQAEAQAREAKIEAALERVRSTAMAMHTSEQLKDVAHELRSQMGTMGQPELEVCAIHLYDESPDYFESWAAFPVFDSPGKTMQVQVKFPKHGIRIVDEMMKHYRSGDRDYVMVNHGKKASEWLNQIKERVPQAYDLIKQNLTKTTAYWSMADFKGGSLVMTTYVPPNDDARKILRRFANVFGLAYQRFADLKQAEAQARESQIQLGLERVRARTMAMHHSNELADVATVLFQQVKALGVPQWVCGFSIWEPGDKEFTWYPGSHDGTILSPCKVPLTEHPVFISFDESRKRGDELFVYEKEGEFQAGHYRYMMTIPGMRELMQNILDAGLSIPAFQIDHIANFSHGNLVFITYEHFPHMHDVFKRFAKVFEQTYTRFLDLQKAEAQAREGQIQLALERVRARTMAMQRSDELLEVVSTLYEQLNNLQFDSNACNIIIIDKESNNQRYWVSGFTQKIFPESYNVPYFKHPYIDDQLQSWKEGRNYIVIEYSGKMKSEFDKQFFSLTDFKNIPVEVQKVISALPSAKLSTAFFTYGALQIIGPHALSEENAAIIQRFAKVFDQTYTRFLDLQKAEAQAREAQIQLALERVRARTMAMHNSEDVTSATATMFDEFKKLGLDAYRFGVVNIHYNRTFDVFGVTDLPGVKMSGFGLFGMDEHPIWQRWFDSWINKEEVFIAYIAGQEKEEYFSVINSHNNYLPRHIINFPDSYFQAYHFEEGAVWAYSAKQHNESEKDIMRRFAKGFSLTFRRYQDLRKAEAQAKEAKIETALEKVRSRSLAMHKSDELQEVVTNVFERLKELEIEMDTSSIIVPAKNENEIEYWFTNAEGYLTGFKLPYFDNYIAGELFNARKKGLELHSKSYSFEEKNEFWNHLIGFTDFQRLPDSRKKFILDSEAFTISIAFSKNTGVQINRYYNKLFSEEENEVLKRFARVFEQAYTRFLDLQKAEEQAREAQIQLALERVRARTMAMHKSEELSETAQVVFQQLNELGAVPDRIAIGIADESNGLVNFWSTDQLGSHINYSFKARLDERTVIAKTYKAWKEQKRSLVIELQGEELEEWIRFAREEMGIQVKDELIKGRRVHHIAYFSRGWILVTTHEPQSAETVQILERFASVFDLTYRRFLDLQKAEIQARESQIQLALERVRARTMAMQKSNELMETAVLLFNQLNHLGENIERTIIGVTNEEERVFDVWATRPDGSQMDKMQKFPIDEPIVMQKVYDAWRQQKKSIVIDLRGEELEGYFQFLKAKSARLKRESFGDRRVENFAFFSKGMLGIINADPNTPATIELYERFAAVFDQTYTRFLDLQKAEAQAREAQIEAALERVRSRTMAMHQSDEIADIVGKIFGELKQLDLVLNRVVIWIFNNEEKYFTWWSANPEAEGAESYRIDYNDQPVFLEYLQAWQKRIPLHQYALSGETKKKWEDHLFSNTGLSKLPAAVQKGMRGEGAIFITSTISDFGLMMVGSFEPLSERNTDIIQRFGKVFQQSYTRYLDVQRAEAQAREARIEAALEKVRSRSLAMHKSEELQEVAHTLIERLRELNVELYTTIIIIFTDDSKDIVWWLENKMSDQFPRVLLRYADVPYLKDLFEAREKGMELFSKCYEGKEKQALYKYLFEETDLWQTPEAQKEFLFGNEFATISVAFAKKTGIHITSYSKKCFSEEETDILKRFAKVFDQSYTRFLDLQKAEAQAREAQIEASLERVRAKAMAMHKSEDLKSAVATVFEELDKLNMGLIRCGIAILDKEKPRGDIWITIKSEEGNTLEVSGDEPLDNHPLLKGAYDAWRKSEDYSYVLEDQDLLDYYESLTPVKFQVPITSSFNRKDGKQYYYNAVFRDGSLFAFLDSPFNDETKTVMKRFASVFDLTYKRFLDLQKAEAQAREARIEMALERIRARALAMHSSNELIEVTKVMREQMALLGQAELESTVVHLYEQDPDHILSWRTFRLDTDTKNEIVHGHMSIPKNSHVFVQEWLEKFYSDLSDYTIELSGTRQYEWYKILGTLAPDVVGAMEKDQSIHEKRYYHFSKFSGGALLMISKQSPAEEAKYLLRRASVVFDLAYRRFGDLQKAEAQAREAQIEAALEKVRAKAMAMHQSQDLGETIRSFYQQLGSLQLMPRRCGVGLIDKETRIADLTGMVISENGETKEIAGQLNLREHPVLINVYESWLQQKEYQPVLRGNEIRDYYHHIGAKISFQNYPEDAVQYGYFFSFREGCVYAWNENPFTEDELKIYRRFTGVLSLTYKRYLDLKQAEAQAREAKIEASLERVRAKTMAMQNSDDVVSATSVLFEELDKLGIKTMRCGVLLFRENQTMEVWTSAFTNDGHVTKIIGNLDMTIHPLLQGIYKAWKNKDEFYSYKLIGDDVHRYYSTISKAYNPYSALGQDPAMSDHYCSIYFFEEGSLYTFSVDEHNDETKQILKKFTAVFSLTFRRYQDLKQAEAQAREARIEAALEKVRSRSLAMHKSDELLDVIMVVSEQLEHLGFKFDNVSFGANNEDYDINFWMAVRDHPRPLQIHAPYLDNPVINRIKNAITNHTDFFADHLTQAENIQWIRHLTEKAGRNFSDEVKSYLTSPHGYARSTVILKHIFLFIGNYLGSPYTDEENAIFKRFANVFDQSYTRFLDLQKAEAQAREAQIEAGLERVRAMTMAMHNSEDVSLATATMLTELEKLDIQNFRGGILNIRENETMEVWSINTLDDGSIVRAIGDFDMKIHPFWQQLYKGWKNKDDYAYFPMIGKDKEDYIRILDARRDYLPNGLQHLPDSHVQSYFFDEGAVWAFSPEPHSEENKQIMKRFAAVFSLTFRRYQDLKNAEAQAKEARIEASLEKVRSKAMAMHNSQDLTDTIGVFYRELHSYSLTPRRCGVGLMDKKDRICQLFTWNTTEAGESLELVGLMKMEGHHVLENIYQHWLDQKEYYPVLRGNEIKRYYQVIRPQIAFPDYEHDVVQFGYFFFFREGGVYAWTEKEMGEDELQIYRRFTTVLSLTYKRYNDLRIAEANAREAKIEAAMEKVRARAMAMQKPGELVEVAELLRKEMGLLGVEELETSSIYIHNEASGTTECWYAIQDVREGDRKLVSDHMTINLNESWVGREMLRFYKSAEKQTSIVMKGDQRREWINYCAQHSKILKGYYGDTIPDRTYHLLKFSNGYMGAASPGELSAESWELLKRATTVFSLAYTRFADLQLAEANAKEAVKQAALDRVRAEIASMRTVGDLERITPLIWNELTILGIPFIRCGVFIMDEVQQTIHTFLSNPEGKAIAAFHLPYSTPGKLGLVLKHWREKKIYVDHWDESSFVELAKILLQQGSINSEEQYLSSLPHGGFYLHFLPFLQGMLYAGNTTQLGDDDIKLIQHVADAFSTAYARYEDFNRLEAAKLQVEQTLTDLKQAQTQLVQSEKMASLGELTAGIAHEIQNPLNFVNNFSDVSNELLQEMKYELERGNAHDAMVLAEDVKQNLEKILHHGKRADAIVKGMLQHSRASSGQKELTDINLLADEYLRLAYHGLRAKDKSFNAKFETDFDPAIEKVNVVPQEIGRVILNLINNAFYAVNEKKKHASTGLSAEQAGSAGHPYEPIVTVTTRRTNGKISISVADNGIGIPQKSLDKIFQPFFTTKPTSQGTGLGLSLAYDIVTKGHGGELKVETKEGEGSEFIVSLPG